MSRIEGGGSSYNWRHINPANETPRNRKEGENRAADSEQTQGVARDAQEEFRRLYHDAGSLRVDSRQEVQRTRLEELRKLSEGSIWRPAGEGSDGAIVERSPIDRQTRPLTPIASALLNAYNDYVAKKEEARSSFFSKAVTFILGSAPIPEAIDRENLLHSAEEVLLNGNHVPLELAIRLDKVNKSDPVGYDDILVTAYDKLSGRGKLE